MFQISPFELKVPATASQPQSSGRDWSRSPGYHRDEQRKLKVDSRDESRRLRHSVKETKHHYKGSDACGPYPHEYTGDYGGKRSRDEYSGEFGRKRSRNEGSSRTVGM